MPLEQLLSILPLIKPRILALTCWSSTSAMDGPYLLRISSGIRCKSKKSSLGATSAQASTRSPPTPDIAPLKCKMLCCLHARAGTCLYTQVSINSMIQVLVLQGVGIYTPAFTFKGQVNLHRCVHALICIYIYIEEKSQKIDQAVVSCTPVCRYYLCLFIYFCGEFCRFLRIRIWIIYSIYPTIQRQEFPQGHVGQELSLKRMYRMLMDDTRDLDWIQLQSSLWRLGSQSGYQDGQFKQVSLCLDCLPDKFSLTWDCLQLWTRRLNTPFCTFKSEVKTQALKAPNSKQAANRLKWTLTLNAVWNAGNWFEALEKLQRPWRPIQNQGKPYRKVH